MPEAGQHRIIRVTVIEDQPDLRDGLALLINGSEDCRCIQAFGSMEEALLGTDPDPPDVVLLDIGLPGMSGIEGVRMLKQRYPQLLVLMLTVYGDDKRIFDAMCGGACGYLLKTTPPDRLLDCLRDVVAGGAPMSPEVARRVIELFRQYHPPQHASCSLSPQETRLLRLLGEGHHYKTAATELGISVHTVRFHLRSIYSKLEVHSKSEAVAKALREGLIR
jgi:DNA-binding NarL/FixJ family response regulator